MPTEEAPATCSFYAVAFAENLSLKDLSEIYPDAKRTPHELCLSLPGGGSVFLFPFGAVVFLNVQPDRREEELARLRQHQPVLSAPTVISEEFTARAHPEQSPQASTAASSSTA